MLNQKISSALVAFALAVPLALAVGCKKSTTPPPNTGSATPNPAFELGVNTHGDGGPLVTSLANMGATWIRADFDWTVLEPQKGAFDFRYTDQLVSNALASGLKIYANLGASPAWTSSNGKRNGKPRPSDWADFVRAASLRYKGQIAVWGIWNEPDAGEFWTGTGKDYADILLRPAIQIIHETDPSSKIAALEVANSANLSQFLADVKKSGAASEADILSFHFYPSTKASEFQNMLPDQMKKITDVAPGKPVFLTEMGFEYYTYSFTKNPTGQIPMSEAEADGASELSKMVRVAAQDHRISAAFIYELIDDPRYINQFRWGIYRSDDSARPIYSSLQTLMTSIKAGSR